jgi:ribosomal protein S18 acetylase RimI-like enzyme
MLDPKYRGQGVGAALMQECVRPKRDQADVLALHSSPIMTAALAMYREMGCVFHRDGTTVFAVPTAVYVMQFIPEDSPKTLVCLHARASGLWYRRGA